MVDGTYLQNDFYLFCEYFLWYEYHKMNINFLWYE